MVISNSLNLQLPLCIYEFFWCLDEFNEAVVAAVDPCAAIAR
jgi:hypothetical protein